MTPKLYLVHLYPGHGFKCKLPDTSHSLDGWMGASPANIWWNNNLHGILTRMRKIHNEETLHPSWCLVTGPRDGHEHTTVYLVLLDNQYDFFVYHISPNSTLLNYPQHAMALQSTWNIAEFCIPKGIPLENNSHSVNVNLGLSFHICHTCGMLAHDFWIPWSIAPSPRKTVNAYLQPC